LDYFAYFGDRDTLAVIVGAQEGDRDVDKALAYGLSYAGDRDLFLVLPAGRTWPTLARAAFLEVPIRVFEHDDVRVTPVIIPSPLEVFASARRGIHAAIHDLGQRQAWVHELILWATAHPDLARADREGSLSWHCRGRQVLRITRVGARLNIVVGVLETGARARHGPPFTLDVDAPMPQARFADVRAAIERAVETRLRGADRLADEHWLQSVLRANPSLLGVDRILREFAGSRPGVDGPQPGFIDLIGVSGSMDDRAVRSPVPTSCSPPSGRC
jgi:hypothetical protein